MFTAHKVVWRGTLHLITKFSSDDLLWCECKDKLSVSGELPDNDGAGIQQTRQPLPQPRSRR